MADACGIRRTVHVHPSTGGQIELQLSAETSVGCLKKAVASRLKVSRERIVLLHKNRQLVEGTLEENKISDGARLTLLPSVETGLVPQRPEQCVMQALETLNDTQVDNFLAGRAPLNLSMRLGDHMMFIQLQLSTSSRTEPSLPTPPSTPTSPDSPGGSSLLFPAAPEPAAPPSPPPSPRAAEPRLNGRALAEASRNLTHTLRQLSSVALNRKMKESCDGRCSTARQQGGAVIESMFHHGRGVYSGTFSGTLSPFLQDKDGRPRRDISTIVHILNDLLGASAHCRPSSQCLCPTSATQPTSLRQHLIDSTAVKVQLDGEKQAEEDVLRRKVEQIQSMLEERRQRRKARRDLRASPYAPGGTKPASPPSSERPDDYSSRTAVA